MHLYEFNETAYDVQNFEGMFIEYTTDMNQISRIESRFISFKNVIATFTDR